MRSNEESPLIDRHAVLSRIMSLMRVPYLFEGTDSTGYDCSGFTSSIYGEELHKEIPHSALAQYSLGSPVEYDELHFADLLFFALEGESASHVGIYVGDGLFAHASLSLGVTISILDSKYYRSRFLGARRILR